MPMPKVLCVIPARLGSTRLSRKALQLIGDKPMVQLTYEAASQCQDISKVIVATDSDEIAQVITAIGGEVQMTATDIKTGSDRVAVVAKANPGYDVVINLQGDEPFIKAAMLCELIEPFCQDSPPVMATLAYPFKDNEEFDSPERVKVIRDSNNNALYFSRSPIPYPRTQQAKPCALHHMGLYAYTPSFLATFCELPQTPCELAESLEQLRALEHGHQIYVKETAHRTLEVNTPEELAMARDLLNQQN